MLRFAQTSLIILSSPFIVAGVQAAYLIGKPLIEITEKVEGILNGNHAA